MKDTYCCTPLSKEQSPGWDLKVVTEFHVLSEVQSLTNNICRKNLENHIFQMLVLRSMSGVG